MTTTNKTETAPALPVGRIWTRTRTGEKIHTAKPGFTATTCGIWLRAVAKEVDPARVAKTPANRICERCTAPGAGNYAR